jgi:cell division protease FtsH
MQNYEKAKNLLNDHVDILNKIATELLEKEVLNGAEIDAIIGDALPKLAQTIDSKSMSADRS